MTPEEHARRSELWQRHVVRGEARATVVADLAAKFDIDEQTLHDDLDTIREWLPRLDVIRDVGGVSMLAEGRANRQQLHQLAEQAREAGDRTEERKVREEINRSLHLEHRIREGKVTAEKSNQEIEFGELMKDNVL